LKVESQALGSAFVMLARAITLTFFTACAALVFFVFWLKNESESSQ
jgi:hypothetical protein